MSKFKGFTDNETFTQLPDTFFHHLLKEIKDADELKVTAYTLWRAQHMDGPFRALSRMDYDVKELGLSAEEIKRGLRLRSFEVDGVVQGTFTPWPGHDNGGGYLNGGIISTLLDCHGAAAVLLEAHRREWKPAPGSDLAFVTAGLDVRFRRPTSLREPVGLTAELLAVAESEMTGWPRSSRTGGRAPPGRRCGSGGDPDPDEALLNALLNRAEDLWTTP